MTSIYNIPYEDIEEFLVANNEIYDDENDAYNKSLELLKNKNAKGHTTKIVEWMIAHNLLLRKIDIPNYSIYQIDNMSQNEIDNLAKLLTMKGNNKNNIVNILRHLHKLKNEILLPEINNIILSNLYQLEANLINSKNLYFNDVIHILKTHIDKALVRRLIYDNMKNIILYNLLNIDIERLDDLFYIESLLYKPYEISEFIILKLIQDNDKRLLKNYIYKQIHSFLDRVDDYDGSVSVGLDSDENIKKLKDFLINLIKIKENALAKRVFDIAAEYRFDILFNLYLIEILTYQEDDVFDKLLEFIGENYFINKLNYFYNFNSSYIKRLLKKLIRLEKYELLIKVLNLLMDKDYQGTRDIIRAILTRIRVKKAIETKNNNLINKYIQILNLGLDGKLLFKKTLKDLQEIDDIITKTEQNEC